MLSFSYHRRLAWLALFAMLFAAIAPSVSKWLAASQGKNWVEVCSANGSKRVALDLGTQKTPDAPMAAESHCAYCVLQQHFPALPTLAYRWHSLAVASHRVPISDSNSFFKRFVREAHSARAPPAFS
jgi:hypothetical protein